MPYGLWIYTVPSWKSIFFISLDAKKTILSSSVYVLLQPFTEVWIHQMKLMEDKGNYTEVKRKRKWEMVPAESPRSLDFWQWKKMVLPESGFKFPLKTTESGTKEHGWASLVLHRQVPSSAIAFCSPLELLDAGNQVCDSDSKQISGIFFIGWDGGSNTYFLFFITQIRYK